VGTKKVLLDVEAAAGGLEEDIEIAEVAEAGTPGGVGKKEKEPVACSHEHADNVLRQEFPDICEALVDKAKEGRILAVKLLLEIAKSAKAKQQGGKSLSEMLMDELKRRQDEREAAADAAKAGEQVASDAGNGDAGNEGAKSGGEAELVRG
jgi:hypothetical protein